MRKSVFLQEEGDTPKNRIWSFLIIHSEYDHSMKDIARHAEVGYTTLKEVWKGFRQKNIIVQTRIVGNAKMYKLNRLNPVVGKFIDYYWTVVDAAVKRRNYVENEALDAVSQDILLPAAAKNL